MSRTVEGLRFLPYLQANPRARRSFMSVGGTHKTPRSETEDVIAHSTADSMSFIFVMVYEQLCPNFEVDIILLDSKQTYLLLQRNTLSLYSKSVRQTNILEKRVWDKSPQSLCSPDVQKQQKPMENVSVSSHLPSSLTIQLNSSSCPQNSCS